MKIDMAKFEEMFIAISALQQCAIVYAFFTLSWVLGIVGILVSIAYFMGLVSLANKIGIKAP